MTRKISTDQVALELAVAARLPVSRLSVTHGKRAHSLKVAVDGVVCGSVAIDGMRDCKRRKRAWLNVVSQVRHAAMRVQGAE